MACRERESKNEIAGFGVLNLPIPAISNAAASEKQNPAQSVRALFTDDNGSDAGRGGKTDALRHNWALAWQNAIEN
jgi:hypothetical protein